MNHSLCPVGRALLLPFLLVVLAGCDGLVYVAHVAQGQFAVQGDVEPIDDVLGSGRLTEEEETKLRLIVKARDFAEQTIGLNAGASYTLFYDTEGDPLAFNLSAARRDALIARTWTFPVIGEVPYLSFFDESYMRLIEQQVIDEGYDTLTYELDAYSTLGVFDDPVRSPMLRRGTLSLVETVIHELLHNTIWRVNATVFNESLATFVGRRGAVEFLRTEFGEDSGWPQLATDLYADTDVVNAFLQELYSELQTFYASPLSPEAKVAEREAIFEGTRQRFTETILPTLHYPDAFAHNADLPTNNAWVLANYRYNLDLGLMADVHAATGEDWGRTLGVFRSAAEAAGDPFAYLRSWLADHPAP